MKRILFFLAFVSLGVTTLTGQKGNGWGQNSNYGRMFNTNTIETFEGTIEMVEKIIPNRGMGYGIHLWVTTDKEKISVHLGPAWFLDNQDLQFNKGDRIIITGSRIIFKGNPAIIAMEIEKNENILQLRDRNGFPRWSGWRKKGMGRNRI